MQCNDSIQCGSRRPGKDRQVSWLPSASPFLALSRNCPPHQGGCGRKAQAKQFKVPGSKGRCSVKATAVYRDLVRNAAANAETKGLDAENCIIEHAQCNRAPPGRRRTYRAHGRIGKYASQPAHIEIILKEKSEGVEKADAPRVKISKKMAAMRRFVKVGAA
jgi:large subunit ribosomal protein L17e